MKVCLQWNVSPKFLLHSSAGLWHFTKAWRGRVWFEDPCPISLSVMQNNPWLVAESNLTKKIQRSIKSIALLKNCKMKSQKILLF